MSNTYRIHGTRYLRKYTAAERSSIYAYMSDVRLIANSLCNVPWERVGRDIAATTSLHTEESIDWNAPERERFDAAEWCADHSDGFHRAYAQAACYVFKLPESAIGTSIEKLGIQVTSDPYNPYGARISAMTSATLDIPMDCATVREGEVYHAPDEDGMGAAPRLFMRNADGTQNWYANTEKVVLEPETPLTAKQYLFVFCCLENYNRARDGWIEGSSYIDNDVELTLSAACADLNDGELNELSVPAPVREFNVCRGGVLPPLVGEVSGVQTICLSLDGKAFDPSVSPTLRELTGINETSAIAIRTAYGLFYNGDAKQLSPAEYGLSFGSRKGSSFSVSCTNNTGNPTGLRYWYQSGMSNGRFDSLAYGNGVFVAGSYDNAGLLYSEDGGHTWTQSNITNFSLPSLAYGNGVFVAGSYNHGIFYSEDGGHTWTQSDQTTGSFTSLAYGNGVFVAGSYDNAGLLYSEDGGHTWTQSDQTTGSFDSLAYGNGVFVAYNGRIMYSEDCGRSWTPSEDRMIMNSNATAIAYGNGVFAAGYAYTSYGIVFSADGGKTWHRRGMNGSSWTSIAYCDGVFFAGSNSGSGVWYSKDGGHTWTQSDKTGGNWRSLACGNGVIVAGSFGNDGLIYSSTKASSLTITSSALFVRTSVPLDFRANKVRLDWTEWTGSATAGSKFNVWLKRGAFADEYDPEIVKNHLVYDAKSENVGSYELVGVIDATDQSKTATFDLGEPLTGEVATFLLTAFVSMDNINPSSEMSLPVGPTKDVYVDHVEKRVVNFESSWKPDITLIG